MRRRKVVYSFIQVYLGANAVNEEDPGWSRGVGEEVGFLGRRGLVALHGSTVSRTVGALLVLRLPHLQCAFPDDVMFSLMLFITI